MEPSTALFSLALQIGVLFVGVLATGGTLILASYLCRVSLLPSLGKSIGVPLLLGLLPGMVWRVGGVPLAIGLHVALGIVLYRETITGSWPKAAAVYFLHLLFCLLVGVLLGGCMELLVPDSLVLHRFY